MAIKNIPDPDNFFIHNLLFLIQLARLDKKLTNVAANALGLLVLKKYSFNKIDFSGLNL